MRSTSSENADWCSGRTCLQDFLEIWASLDSCQIYVIWDLWSEICDLRFVICDLRSVMCECVILAPSLGLKISLILFTSRNTSGHEVWNGNDHKKTSWNRQLLAQGRNHANHVGAGKKIYLILVSINRRIASNYCLSMDQWHHGVQKKWDRQIWS